MWSDHLVFQRKPETCEKNFFCEISTFQRGQLIPKTCKHCDLSKLMFVRRYDV